MKRAGTKKGGAAGRKRKDRCIRNVRMARRAGTASRAKSTGGGSVRTGKDTDSHGEGRGE